MQKWEYLFLIVGRANESWKVVMANGRELQNWKNGPSLYEYANHLGDEGWELVSQTFAPIFTQSAFVDSEDYRMVFKRAKE